MSPNKREAAQARLEHYVTYCIQSQGKDRAGKYKKREGHTTVMFLRACPASIELTDIHSIPLDYQTATVTMLASILNDVLDALDEDLRGKVLAEIASAPDKWKIKAAIETGIEVPGARLITGKTSLARKQPQIMATIFAIRLLATNRQRRTEKPLWLRVYRRHCVY